MNAKEARTISEKNKDRLAEEEKEKIYSKIAKRASEGWIHTEHSFPIEIRNADIKNIAEELESKEYKVEFKPGLYNKLEIEW